MLLLLIASSFSQTPPAPCADTAGQHARYRFEYASTQARGTTAFTRVFDIAVQPSDDPIALTWTSVSSEVGETRGGVAAAATEAIVTTDLPVLHATVHPGEASPTVAFKNMGDAAAALREPVQQALQTNLEALQSPPDVPVEELVDVVVSEEVLQKSLESYILPIYTYGCRPLPAGSTQTELTLPNPLGGAPLPAVRTVTIHPPTDQGDVRLEERIGLSDAAIEQLATLLGIETEDTETPQVLTITTHTDVTMASDGFPDSWTISQQVSLLGQGASEVTRVQRLPEP